ncbi:YycH protein [Peptoclostridium litorale DSM 5388]|uniref:Uncharacterized protein n=2 Tax=Peptoclostridium litorale TaxID=1557 RepID=A0A069RHR7_PEPLI|nr:two-component system activity regulator YycH [Peptoclostridium litorale]KDR96343.1 hypothetical protein CLIT_4c01800 [Peptoclostridium litorale DSM 5388]SIO26689.1 YycH protein [Peptoclostridium litorale DSM 5388]
MSREKLKTILLTFLFMTSIVLTGLNLNIIDYKSSENTFGRIDANKALDMVLQPERIFVHFGGGGGNNIEVIEGRIEYWKELRQMLKNGIANTMQVSEKDFNESQELKQLKSVEIKLPFDISGSFFTSALGLEKSKLDKYDGIESIIIPLVDDSGIYFLLSDGNAVRMERTKIEKSQIVQQLESELEQGNLVRYYMMSTLFPVDSDVLMPVDASGYKYLYFRGRNSVQIENEGRVVQMAKNIFGEKYDFVNRIVETGGANTFIYGFGERVLRMQPDGAIEYLDETIKGSGINQNDAIAKAVDFASKLGVKPSEMNLNKVEKSQIYGKDAYEFVFSYNIEGLKLKSYDSSIEDIAITVAGDSVYSYQSNIKSIEDNMTVNLFSKNDILSPQTILNDNFDFLKREFEINMEKGKNDEVSTNILGRIKSVELVYFLADTNVFTPAWCFYMEGQNYIFDAYTGEILNYGLGKI